MAVIWLPQGSVTATILMLGARLSPVRPCVTALKNLKKPLSCFLPLFQSGLELAVIIMGILRQQIVLSGG